MATNTGVNTPMQSQGPLRGTKAFGDDADARLIVAYDSHQDALRFLSSTLGRPSGVALLQGPKGAGKSTILREQADWTRREAPVALLGGIRLTPRQLVSGMLSQFGVDKVPDQDEQILQAASRYLTRRFANSETPVLFIDDFDRASESTQRMLNWLAALECSGNAALRIVLSGRERLTALVRQPLMRDLGRRNPGTYSLNPLSEKETAIYLRTRLLAAGVERGDKVFPLETCSKLHEKSLGWPGKLNELALQAMSLASEMSAARPVPRIVVTRDGNVVNEYELTEHQYVIGRTDLADIVVEDPFVSKLHAIIQVYSNALVLLDLNSTNGTTVNSLEKRKTLLRENDIISLGHHRLKVLDAPPLTAEMSDKIRAADTLTLRNIEDIRKLRARHNVAALKRS